MGALGGDPSPLSGEAAGSGWTGLWICLNTCSQVHFTIASPLHLHLETRTDVRKTTHISTVTPGLEFLTHKR